LMDVRTFYDVFFENQNPLTRRVDFFFLNWSMRKELRIIYLVMFWKKKNCRIMMFETPVTPWKMRLEMVIGM